MEALPSAVRSADTRSMGKRRWLIRSAIAALVVLPVPSVLLYGCESATQFDDLCGFQRDPNNCYREFFIDVGVTCGVPAPQTRTGEFVAREELGTCFLTEGGLVEFNPPIDPTVPLGMTVDPETGEATPTKLEFEILNADQTFCGAFEFTSKYDFKVFIQGDPLPEDFDADADVLPDDFLVGGTFSADIAPCTLDEGEDNCTDESEVMNVTCPDPGTEPDGDEVLPDFIFNRLQVTTCRDLEPILPHMEIDFNPGGIEEAGVIRMTVFYPPQEGDLPGAQPVPVNYFECFIPAAPPLCENGVKDGAETDIDCGGGFCAARCVDEQGCINDDDCLSDSCIIFEGFKVCAGP